MKNYIKFPLTLTHPRGYVDTTDVHKVGLLLILELCGRKIGKAYTEMWETWYKLKFRLLIMKHRSNFTMWVGKKEFNIELRSIHTPRYLPCNAVRYGSTSAAIRHNPSQGSPQCHRMRHQRWRVLEKIGHNAALTHRRKQATIAVEINSIQLR